MINQYIPQLNSKDSHSSKAPMRDSDINLERFETVKTNTNHVCLIEAALEHKPLQWIAGRAGGAIHCTPFALGLVYPRIYFGPSGLVDPEIDSGLRASLRTMDLQRPR